MSDKDKAPEEKPEVAKPTFQEQFDSIKDSPEFATYLNQYKNQVIEFVEPELGRKAMGKGWKEVDDAILTELGLEKRPEGMNTSQFAAHIAKKLKALEANAPTEEDKTKKEETSKLHEAEKEQLRKELEDLRLAQNELLEREFGNSVKGEINSFLSGQAFKQNYTKEDLAELKDVRINGILARAKKVDGKTIIYQKDGTPYLNNGLPMNAQEVAAIEFKSMFQVKAPGGNSDDDTTATVVKGDVLTMANTNTIKTYAEFISEFAKAVAPKGWAAHEERTTKLKKATYEHYFPNKLPM